MDTIGKTKIMSNSNSNVSEFTSKGSEIAISNKYIYEYLKDNNIYFSTNISLTILLFFLKKKATTFTNNTHIYFFLVFINML